ncbi:hypothetical protein [Enterococcus casseliflavus]|uniref:hypothetical protein n=1 Tax=Enterococcus casseliflavus TaxID=37734 RepID=UPI0035D6D6B4
MNMLEYNLFFDESTVLASSDNPLEVSLMGCLIVPKSYYELESITIENNKVKSGEYKLHFTAFKKSDKRKYRNVLNAFLKNPKILKMNLISFERKDVGIISHVAYSSENMKDMIYSKLPERTIYGGVRNISKFRPIHFDLYIENSNEYTSLKINDALKTQLNSQALYRNDSFCIRESKLYGKNQEIGIEVTDTLIGIISILLRNPSKYDATNKVVKSRKEKLKFIYDNKDIIESFLPSVNYFELGKSGQFIKRDLDKFFHEFILKYEFENPQIDITVN